MRFTESQHELGTKSQVHTYTTDLVDMVMLVCQDQAEHQQQHHPRHPHCGVARLPSLSSHYLFSSVSAEAHMAVSVSADFF